MLDRIRDLRTTLPALVIGGAAVVAMLYAMHERPAWGIPEIIALGSGVATIVGGALVRSERASETEPTKPSEKLP